MRTRFWLSRGPHSQCRILFLNREDPRHLLLRLSRARETTHGHHANCELGEGRHGLSTVSHHEERESALPGMVGLEEARIRTLIGTRQICHWASVCSDSQETEPGRGTTVACFPSSSPVPREIHQESTSHPTSTPSWILFKN